MENLGSYLGFGICNGERSEANEGHIKRWSSVKVFERQHRQSEGKSEDKMYERAQKRLWPIHRRANRTVEGQCVGVTLIFSSLFDVWDFQFIVQEEMMSCLK